jgi:hypothetical protein
MGGRSRIRWDKVAKFALAGFGCLALFMGLPSLIRRPEPPPLQPDIGLAHVAAPPEPAPSESRSGPVPQRRAAKGNNRDRHLALARSPRGSRRPTLREQEPPSTASPATGVSGPARMHTATPMTTAAPPLAPTPPPPPAPPSAQARPSQAAAESEFGFER